MAILLLLQTRGKVTAAEVADELEISERTARRDLDALGMAGIPVYSSQGRGGGWQLIGGATTDLTGLTSAEARALFLVAGPSSEATPEVKAALRKLVGALPETFRSEAEAASAAVVVDPTGWWAGSTAPRPTPTHLDALQEAVIEGRQVVLGYVAGNGDATTRTVHPLGLAAKGAVWYLVAGTERGQRTFRVDRVASVELTADPVVRPEGFDLAAAWREVTASFSQRTAALTVRATASPSILGILRYVLGPRVRIGPAGDDGRVEVEVSGDEAHMLAAQLAGFGSDVVVLEPPEVRAELAAITRQLVAEYLV